MGLNMGLVYVRGAEIEDLAAIGLVPTGERMSADVASTSPDGELVVARPAGGWLLLVGPELLIGVEDELIARSLDREVVVAMLGSTGDTFSFARCDPGGARRHLVDAAGERAVDEGPPLPQEAGIDQLTEDTIQHLAVEVTGVNFWDSFMEEDWQVLGRGSAEPERPARRRGVIARILGRSGRARTDA